MTSYKIEWKQSAKKELKKLDKQIIPRVLQAVESLADNPYSSGSKKLIGSNSNYICQYKIAKITVLEF